MIAIGAADHLADHAGEWAGRDPDHRADGNGRLLGDNQPRADHGVNLTKVAGQLVLIDDFEDRDQSIAAEGRQAIVAVPFKNM